MVEKVQGKNPPVTFARMIKLNKEQLVLIPPEFFENLSAKDPEKRWAIMLLSPSAKIIRTILTKSPEVLKLQIEYSSSEDFLNELGEVFMSNKLKIIYSTGMCFFKPPYPCGRMSLCPYVAYIDSSDLTIPEDQLRSELCAKSTINNVEVTTIELEGL